MPRKMPSSHSIPPHTHLDSSKTSPLQRTSQAPAAPGLLNIGYLQQTIGNQATLQLLAKSNSNSEGGLISTSPAMSGKGIIQAKWIKVRGSGEPGDYYWDSATRPPEGAPPGGGNIVQAPAFQSIQPVHRARPGNMKALRTAPDYPEARLNLLAHLSHQAANQSGLFYPDQSQTRGLGRKRVRDSIPDRDSSKHTKIFRRMTGGESSSTKYQQKLGTAHPGTKYQILHGMGHGQGGEQTQHADNLASASEGANTEMIPFDNAISGNTQVSVDTTFTMRGDTHRAESIQQNFFHEYYEHGPIFSRTIDGDRPKPTVSEYEEWEEEALDLKDSEALGGSAILLNMKHGKHGFAPGNHPLDRDPEDDDSPGIF